jgi:outer membrane protein insertion porin family
MKTKTSILLAGAALISAVSVHAEEVKKVTVQGNERVEDTAVLSYINLESGDDYNPSQSSRIIKNLYNTGLFNNV